MLKTTDKRTRLIEAAKTLIYHRGFNLTTLADIAEEAQVPLGNVYYYFKTKEAIGVTVIEGRTKDWAARLVSWSEQADALARIMSLLQYSLDELELTARYGCPVGSLCQELGKKGGALADLAAKLLHDIIHWSEIQFTQLGFGEKSASHALELISRIQGMFLLAHTFKDPKLAEQQAEHIHAWLESITSRKIDAPIIAKATELEVVEEVVEAEVCA